MTTVNISLTNLLTLLPMISNPGTHSAHWTARHPHVVCILWIWEYGACLTSWTFWTLDISTVGWIKKCPSRVLSDYLNRRINSAEGEKIDNTTFDCTSSPLLFCSVRLLSLFGEALACFFRLFLQICLLIWKSNIPTKNDSPSKGHSGNSVCARCCISPLIYRLWRTCSCCLGKGEPLLEKVRYKIFFPVTFLSSFLWLDLPEVHSVPKYSREGEHLYGQYLHS